MRHRFRVRSPAACARWAIPVSRSYQLQWFGDGQIGSRSVRDELADAALHVAQDLAAGEEAVRAAGCQVVNEQVVIAGQHANRLSITLPSAKRIGICATMGASPVLGGSMGTGGGGFGLGASLPRAK